MKNKVLIRPLPSFFDLLEQKRRRWARGGKYTGKNMLFLLPNRNRNILFLLEGWYHEQRNGWCIIVIGSSIQTQIDYLSWHVKWMTPWHHHAVSKKTRTDRLRKPFSWLSVVLVALSNTGHGVRGEKKWPLDKRAEFRKVAVGEQLVPSQFLLNVHNLSSQPRFFFLFLLFFICRFHSTGNT